MEIPSKSSSNHDKHFQRECTGPLCHQNLLATMEGNNSIPPPPLKNNTSFCCTCMQFKRANTLTHSTLPLLISASHYQLKPLLIQLNIHFEHPIKTSAFCDLLHQILPHNNDRSKNKSTGSNKLTYSDIQHTAAQLILTPLGLKTDTNSSNSNNISQFPHLDKFCISDKCKCPTNNNGNQNPENMTISTATQRRICTICSKLHPIAIIQNQNVPTQL